VEAQPTLQAERLIFLDEAGVDPAMSQEEGWAKVGETPIIDRPLRGQRVNMLGAMTVEGILALKMVETTVTGAVFLDFLRTTLCPLLRPGDVVVMDGPPIHRVAGVVKALEQCGARVLYLPAYSPELNPIEWVWSWLKRQFRKCPPRKVALVRQRVQEILGKVTASLCKTWIRGCNYVLST